jgi:hypothetical protein
MHVPKGAPNGMAPEPLLSKSPRDLDTKLDNIIGAAALIAKIDLEMPPRVIYLQKRDLSKCQDLTQWRTLGERAARKIDPWAKTNWVLEEKEKQRKEDRTPPSNLFSERVEEFGSNCFRINDANYTEDYDILVQENTDIIDETTGQFIARFRKHIIPPELAEAGLQYHDPNTTLQTRPKKTGRYVDATGSALLAGYIEPKISTQKCRLTTFSHKHLERYESGLPFIQLIDEAYRYLLPEAYEAQWQEANKNSSFVIKNHEYQTAFSTVTINASLTTSLHKDAGDYGGYGTLTVLGGGYSGGYTVFPEYGFAINVRPQDFVAMNVHEWHFNTAIELHSSPTQNALRMAFVCYFKEKVGTCTMREELSLLTWGECLALLLGVDYEATMIPVLRNYGMFPRKSLEVLHRQCELQRWSGQPHQFGRYGDKYVYVYPDFKASGASRASSQQYYLLFGGNNNTIRISWVGSNKRSDVLVNNHFHFKSINTATFFYLYNHFILPLTVHPAFGYVDEKVLGNICLSLDNGHVLQECLSLKMLNPWICDVPTEKECNEPFCALHWDAESLTHRCVNKLDSQHAHHSLATDAQKCSHLPEHACKAHDTCAWEARKETCEARTSHQKAQQLKKRSEPETSATQTKRARINMGTEMNLTIDKGTVQKTLAQSFAF